MTNPEERIHPFIDADFYTLFERDIEGAPTFRVPCTTEIIDTAARQQQPLGLAADKLLDSLVPHSGQELCAMEIGFILARKIFEEEAHGSGARIALPLLEQGLTVEGVLETVRSIIRQERLRAYRSSKQLIELLVPDPVAARPGTALLDDIAEFIRSGAKTV